MEGSSSLTPIATKRLEGKIAFITGGASGIGEATARLFVHHGAKVVIADVQDDLGRSICDEMGSSNDADNIFYIHCDVASESDVETAINATISKYGKLDIAYSNAGVSGNEDTSILAINEESFKRVFEVNVYGGFLLAKHAARVMIPEKKGSIIFTSSVASVNHGGLPHAYVASKHAVVGLMKNLCVELGRHGIRVNCISPYAVATPMMVNGMKMRKEDVERVYSEAGNLKGVVLRGEDVAEAAMFLGSDESKYVSGINLVVDGGYSITNVSAALADATNCISPFGVATPMMVNGMRMEKEDVGRLYLKAGNLQAVVLRGEDVAELAMFLASNESKYVSGLNLVVDGGYSITNVSAALAV